ncbi:hypothetical protein [Krasilnikovia sp. MM14-A1259]|uniref:hypothetical protein n=1 Tax=Krasilnikovia sp. MM14-A1259 TaxID=3373539 RepID=UPI003809B20B
MNPSQEPASPHGAEPSYPSPPAAEPSYAPTPPPRAEPSYLIPPLDAPAPAGDWAPPAAPPQPATRPWRRTVSAGALTALVVALAGVPLGLIWTWLAPSVPVLNAGANGIVVNDPSPEQYIAADGWFAILGFVFGLAVAITAWMVLRRYRGPALLVGVTVGTLAAAAAAWAVGREVGLHAYEQWRETSAPGATYSAPPDLHAYGVLLIPAFAAVIVLTLLAGWSSDPDLDRAGAGPGHDEPSAAPGADLLPGPGSVPGWTDGQPPAPAGDLPPTPGAGANRA